MILATSSELNSLFEKHALPWWGVAKIQRPHTFEIYRQWIHDGKHGQMEYLALHLPQKENPQTLLPQARTALTVAVNYKPHPSANEPFKHLPVASYAQGDDYHFWLKARLQALIEDLQQLYPKEVFLSMTDSAPVLERDFAHQSGLGWFGKNTCLIHPQRGSFFLLGEIYTSLELTAQLAPQPDHCGTCTRCLDACPTQALTSPRVLDPRLCISYWTIEARTVPPEPLREKIGQQFFGCDICQDVCPWNKKIFSTQLQPKNIDKMELTKELRFILESSNKTLEKVFFGTPLTRPGGRGLKRNAMLVAVHYRCNELRDLIENVGRQYPELTELSQWAMTRLSQGSIVQ